MNKIKVGDQVQIIAGKDKGKSGSVLSFNGNYLVVEGCNIYKKAQKPDPDKGIQGGLVEVEAKLHRSNVCLIDNKGKASRVGVRQLNDGTKVRYFKSTDEDISS